MKDVVPVHHIQKKLFNMLVSADALRYSELKPKELEANLFMYHLKELIKLGLVEKVDTKYTLSTKGKQVATRFSIREEKIRVMPSTISVVVLRAPDGEWLLYRRKRQPYIDAIGFPSGKIHLGDSLRDAAYRELREKCGYDMSDVDPEHAGMFNLVESSDEQVITHIIGQVWVGMVRDKKAITNHAGETFWDEWANHKSEFMLGTQDVIQHLDDGNFFTLDMNFETTTKG